MAFFLKNVQASAHLCYAICSMIGYWWGVQICQPIATVIPSPEAQVNPAHEGNRLVNGHHFLMMSPKKHHGCHVVWMPQHLDNSDITQRLSDLSMACQV